MKILKGTAAVLAVTLATAVVVGAIVFGGWELGWWFTNHNVSRQAHLYRNSYDYQQTLRDQVTANIGTVISIGPQVAEATDPGTKKALEAQRSAVLAIVCQEADEVTGDPLPPDQQQFVQLNCEAGVVSPSSPYSQGVNP